MSTSENELVRSGIDQLDELLHGGFPKGRCILVSGGCGTGKSIFGVQFLVVGATKYGENGILITTEESPSAVRTDMKSFKWNLEKLEQDGKLGIIDIASPKSKIPYAGKSEVARLLNMNTLLLALTQLQKSINAKRVVLDSIPGLELVMEEPGAIRHAIHRLISTLKELGCTTLLISEGREKGEISRYDVEEFVSDGVIYLEQIRQRGKFERGLTIIKMRGTNHESKTNPMVITEKGVSVIPIRGESMSSSLES